MSKPVIVRVGSKVVGMYHPDTNTYVKNVSKALHLMKMMDGYGMDESIYERCIKKDANIQIVEDKKTVYKSHVSLWQSVGVTRNFGHGPQRFLSKKYMDVESLQQPQGFGH